MGKLRADWGSKLAPIVVFIIPFWINYNFVVDSFYRCRAHLFDSGLVAGILWQNTWALLTPTVAGSTSFLQTHTTLIYWFASALSYWVPLNMVQMFGLFLGVAYAIPAIALYFFLLSQWPLLGPVGAGVLGVLFAFNGITQAMIGYPHTEITGVALLIAFFCSWASRHYRWAIACLILGLMVREDMGLHAFSILALVVGAQWWRDRQFWRESFGRWTLGFAVAAFLYSASMILLQKTLFPGGDNALARVYLGNPPLAHVSVAMLTERLGYYLTTRQHLYFPAIATLVMALYPRRRWGLAIGFVAYSPWFLLHFVAITEMPGLLKAYYAFPFVISLAWPLIWPWMYPPLPTAATKRWALQTFTAVLLCSIVGGWVSPAGSVDLSSFTRHPNIRAFDAVGRAIAATATTLKPIAVDESVASLFPQQFQPSELLSADPQAQTPVQTVLYCDPSLEPELLTARLRSQPFAAHYHLRHTPLHLQTNLSPAALGPPWQDILASDGNA